MFPRELIIDANIFFSFFKCNSTRRFLIEELLNSGCVLKSPDFVLEELRKDKNKILKFSCLEPEEFEFLFGILKEEIHLRDFSEYDSFLSEAKTLSPHDSEKDDPYFALSLSLNNCPIWSDEKGFSKQNKIKIFSTKELLELLI